jgi:hypothetical protein
MMNHMNGGHQIRFCMKSYSIVYCVFPTCSFDFCVGSMIFVREIFMNLTAGRLELNRVSCLFLSSYYYCKILLMYLSR